ncbi:Vesicular glutamate transporter 2 [Eufriesea mexicana]|uniref:Vesicular glutamate transporter 2 n=1 Tax=Eufriesea mexicana TaxID=516756 RepID=A0A310SCB3_9HYME|nr:Vesicular glutamate transporter 2 [Eufriesea mexicana]
MKLLVSTGGPSWAVAGQDRHFASQPHGVELNHPCGLTVDGTSPSASMCPSPSRKWICTKKVLRLIRYIQEKAVLSCRDVLWYVAFCGFAINYMLRMNLNLTIVAMVVPHPMVVTTAECNDNARSYNGTHKIGFTTSSSNRVKVVHRPICLVRVPARLSSRSLLLATLDNATSWWAFSKTLRDETSLRLRKHHNSDAWLPHSVYDTLSYLRSYIPKSSPGDGVRSSVGTAITYPLCAAISDTLGWGAAFYVTSSLGVIWFCFWLFLIYDSPQDHPRISDEEKNYILQNLASTVDDEQIDIPWRSILTSGQVWMTIMSHWGGGWGFLTLITQAPTYFNFIHGWNIKATGMISGVPHLIRMIFSYYYSMLSDWLVRTKKMSLTNVRKLATFMATSVQGAFILLLGYSGCHPTLAIIFMMAGTITNGAISAGTLASFIDLSPNYASLLLGLCGMVVIGCGFISPLVVGILTENNQTISQWRLVFIIAAVNSIVGSIMFLAFGTSEEQPWNTYGKLKKENDQEMQRLTATPFVKCEGNKKVDGMNKNRMVMNE